MAEYRFLMHRRTIEEWEALNIILGEGEFGIVLDTQPAKYKIGDGLTAWNALPYVLDNEAIQAAIDGFSAGQITAQIGVAPPPNVTVANVITAGTYHEYGDLVVSSGDLLAGFVQFYKVGSIWDKKVLPVPGLDAYTKEVDFEPVKERTENIYVALDDAIYFVDGVGHADGKGNVMATIDKDGVHGKNITDINTLLSSQGASIESLLQDNQGFGSTCKIQESKGTYIFPTSATINGANATITQSKSDVKWAKKSFEAKFSGTDVINLSFGKTVVGATTIAMWWKLPFKFNQGNIDYITWQLTLAGNTVGTSIQNFIQYDQQGTGWNLKKWLLAEFGSPAIFDGIRISVVLTAGAVVYGNYKCQLFIDSIVVNQRLRPSVAISYDSVWVESYTAGVFQYHKDNNLPFNITDKDINQSTSTAPYYVYAKNLVKDRLACVTVYSGAMRTGYSTYTQKRDFIKGELDIANNQAEAKVISIGCQGNVSNESMNIAFKEIGAKMIRANGAVFVNYIDDFLHFGCNGYYSINTNTTGQENTVIAAAKNYIDKLIISGAFGCVMTHGVMPLASITVPSLHSSDYVWFSILDYIKAKSNAGLIDVVKFDDILYAASGLNNQ